MTRQTFAFAAPPGQPTEIVTETSEEFLALCDRQDRGELVIEAVSRGNGNAQWVCEVRYPKGELQPLHKYT